MILSLLLMLGCTEEKPTDTSEEEQTETAAEEPSNEDTSTTETSLCDEPYSFCGSLMMPDDFTGTTRSMSVALFSSLPPAGPPDYALAQVELPEFATGTAYPIEIGSVTALGDYHLFVAVYMEGGGEWQPEPGIDYMYSSPDTFTFDGSAIDFGEINLMLAE